MSGQIRGEAGEEINRLLPESGMIVRAEAAVASGAGHWTLLRWSLVMCSICGNLFYRTDGRWRRALSTPY